ncbi:hypothetical protein [Sporichthya polymorpha]|uniref:hypothetical protein n=1 Tax=Sporichthya polymorpha TaxID=35751 RepID=UPI000374C210|nr:hypothetical protein [Sporichthya polymorpha]
MSNTAMTLDRQSLLAAAESAPQLFAALDRIAVEGWNSSTGDVVLAYARREVVRPAVRSAGLVGSAAEAAEASGWTVAWEALAGRGIRSAGSPWGFVATAVRRAVVGERMAERYRTATRTAWRVEQFRASGGGDRRRAGEWRAVADDAALTRPLSLTALVEQGYDRPVTDELPSEADPTIDLLAGVLTRGGWSPAAARETVLHVAEHGVRNRPEEAEVPGWRSLALYLGVPGWQARRLTVLLLGAPGWPGLVERLVSGGPAALRGSAVDLAVRATREAGLGTPARTVTVAPELVQGRSLAS